MQVSRPLIRERAVRVGIEEGRRGFPFLPSFPLISLTLQSWDQCSLERTINWCSQQNEFVCAEGKKKKKMMMKAHWMREEVGAKYLRGPEGKRERARTAAAAAAPRCRNKESEESSVLPSAIHFKISIPGAGVCVCVSRAIAFPSSSYPLSLSLISKRDKKWGKRKREKRNPIEKE